MNSIGAEGKERLAHLEDKVFRVSALFHHISKKNQQLEEEIRQESRKAREWEDRCRKLQETLELVKREREAVLDELACIRGELAGLLR